MRFTINSFFKGPGIKKFIPGIAWFMVVMILMFTPGNALPHLDDWFHKIYGDKWVHAGVFGLLAFLFMYPLNNMELERRVRGHYFIRIALATSIWGFTTECVQGFFIPGRSYDLLDWAADCVGVFIAFWYCRQKFLKVEH